MFWKKKREEKQETDIRKTDDFDAAAYLGMRYFRFEEAKAGDDTLIVHADREWWNYQAEITFHQVFWHSGTRGLDWVLCRMGTEEEVKELRSEHTFPEDSHVYCFEDTSKYYIKGPIPIDVSGNIDPEFSEKMKKSLSIPRQPRKSFVIAQSVTIVAFFSDRLFGPPFDQWQKGELADFSEDFQQVFLRAIESSIRFAKSVKSKKGKKRAKPLRPIT